MAGAFQSDFVQHNAFQTVVHYIQAVGTGAVISASTLGRKIKITIGGVVTMSGGYVTTTLWLAVRLFTRAYHKVTLSTRDY